MAGSSKHKWFLGVINRLKKTASATDYRKMADAIIRGLGTLPSNIKLKHVSSYEMVVKVPSKKPLEDVDSPEYVHIFELNGGQLMTEKQAKDYYQRLRGVTGSSLTQPLQDVKSKMLMPQSRWVLFKGY